MHHDLSQDEIDFRDKCKTFSREVIQPNVIKFDRENRFPDLVHDEAEKRNLLNVCIPKELGGQGISFKAMAEGGYEMAQACPAITFTMGFNHGAMRPIIYAGTEEQKDLFIRQPIEKNRGYTALALTEKDVSGSNLIAVKTRAEKTDRGWVISGNKSMVGMGTEAQQFLVLAETWVNGRNVGLTFFNVPRTGAVDVSSNTDKLGFRAVPTPDVTFNNVEIDEINRIGEIGEAEPILFHTLDFIRYGGGIIILGTIEGLLRELIPWLESREVFGNEKLIGKSWIQTILGETYAKHQSLRLLLRRVADLLDKGISATEESAVLKLLSSELAVSAASKVMPMYGWRGIDNEFPIQKRFRDAQQTTIFEGTSGILQIGLCHSLLRKIRAEDQQ